ncbi:TPA: hypothetical protein N0F65_012385 [Lagenidium giganteum]|uniref:Uncharacterized protein n=1 Tax=Lagenidium giganteum TaxID=4803 RepID=A0AAV2YQ33_9STRA|nr:TPA: hypothetical protein N0F65_012385 [Lagenidium giganteum]
MATAAAGLLDWQPLFQLQSDNYQLREQNCLLQSQVTELLRWKEKALHHMVLMGPKRCKAHDDIQQAQQMKQKLQAVEKTLQERMVLEQATQRLEASETELRHQVDELTSANEELQAKLQCAQEQETIRTKQLEVLKELFQMHLEKLVAIRERVDGKPAGPTSVNVGEVNEGDEHAINTPRNDAQATCSGEDGDESGVSVITALTEISDKCATWLLELVAKTEADAKTKSSAHVLLQDEVQRLRDQVAALERDRQVSTQRQHELEQQAAALQTRKTQLEDDCAQLQAHYTSSAHLRASGSEQLRVLLTEIRYYLRLVRVEIRKKFGYVPEAIAHSHHWARILEALGGLEQVLRT